jgi:hypothetical protein
MLPLLAHDWAAHLEELKNIRTASLIVLSGLFVQVAHADEIRHTTFPNVMLGTWARQISRRRRRLRGTDSTAAIVRRCNGSKALIVRWCCDSRHR